MEKQEKGYGYSGAQCETKFKNSKILQKQSITTTCRATTKRRAHILKSLAMFLA